jgi:hypothetical protein
MLPSTSCEVSTINTFMVVLPFWSSGFPLSSIDVSHQNRSLGGQQLDNGIGDTLVGVGTVRATLPGLGSKDENRVSHCKCCETQPNRHLVDFHRLVVLEFIQRWGVPSRLCAGCMSLAHTLAYEMG